MFEVFNMGTGFCYVVSPSSADRTISILKQYGREAQKIGFAVADVDKRVTVPQRNIVGKHKTFVEEGVARKVV
jgi:phosphoribosylaminoimidazole (AIR) synthetase